MVNDLSPEESEPIVGAPGAVADQIIVHIGVEIVVPVAELVILQIRLVVPAKPLPVTVVDEDDGLFIVEFVPVLTHEYVKFPPPLFIADAEIVGVVELLPAETEVLDIEGCNDDITIPKKADINLLYYLNNKFILCYPKL